MRVGLGVTGHGPPLAVSPAAGMMHIVLGEGYDDMVGDIADGDLGVLIDRSAYLLRDAAAGRQ